MAASPTDTCGHVINHQDRIRWKELEITMLEQLIKSTEELGKTQEQHEALANDVSSMKSKISVSDYSVQQTQTPPIPAVEDKAIEAISASVVQQTQTPPVPESVEDKGTEANSIGTAQETQTAPPVLPTVEDKGIEAVSEYVVQQTQTPPVPSVEDKGTEANSIGNAQETQTVPPVLPTVEDKGIEAVSEYVVQQTQTPPVPTVEDKSTEASSSCNVQQTQTTLVPTEDKGIAASSDYAALQTQTPAPPAVEDKAIEVGNDYSMQYTQTPPAPTVEDKGTEATSSCTARETQTTLPVLPTVDKGAIENANETLDSKYSIDFKELRCSRADDDVLVDLLEPVEDDSSSRVNKISLHRCNEKINYARSEAKPDYNDLCEPSSALEDFNSNIANENSKKAKKSLPQSPEKKQPSVKPNNITSFIRKRLEKVHPNTPAISGFDGTTLCYKQLLQVITHYRSTLSKSGFLNGDQCLFLLDKSKAPKATTIAVMLAVWELYGINIPIYCEAADLMMLPEKILSDSRIEQRRSFPRLWVFSDTDAYAKALCSSSGHPILSKYSTSDIQASKDDLYPLKGLVLLKRLLETTSESRNNYKTALRILSYPGEENHANKVIELSHEVLIEATEKSMDLLRASRSKDFTSFLSFDDVSSFTFGLFPPLLFGKSCSIGISVEKQGGKFLDFVLTRSKSDAVIATAQDLSNLWRYLEKNTSTNKTTMTTLIYIGRSLPAIIRIMQCISSRAPSLAVKRAYPCPALGGIQDVSNDLLNPLDISMLKVVGGSSSSTNRSFCIYSLKKDNVMLKEANKAGELHISPRSTRSRTHVATGDVAYRDESGRIHLLGCKEQLITIRGSTILPLKFEEVLLSHPIVEDAVLLLHNKELKLFVQTVPKASTISAQAIKLLKAFCDQNLVDKNGKLEISQIIPTEKIFRRFDGNVIRWKLLVLT